MAPAQPSHQQRFIVLVMMRIDSFDAADFTAELFRISKDLLANLLAFSGLRSSVYPSLLFSARLAGFAKPYKNHDPRALALLQMTAQAATPFRFKRDRI
jgi:hypothetical protein